MEDTNFNYIDAARSSALQSYASDNDLHSINLTGRLAYVFLLDKTQGTFNEVYNEPIYGRTYLPHFEIRSRYKTATIKDSLNLKIYTESEENMQFYFNFKDMVNKIHILKTKSSGKITFTNNWKKPLNVEISDREFRVYTESMAEIFNYKLEDYETVQEFVESIDTELFSLSYEGNTEKAINIENKNFNILPKRKIEIEVSNSVYENIADVITNGCIICTDQYKFYQVNSAIPIDDNFGSQFIGWQCIGSLINAEIIDGLPDDFRSLAKRNSYGDDKLKYV